jgi:hypothetical protein
MEWIARREVLLQLLQGLSIKYRDGKEEVK